jgi:hypothetical protein
MFYDEEILYMLNMGILRIACFAHFQSLINYDIIFWGSSTSMCTVYLIQKRIIRNTIPQLAEGIMADL